jgi:hypothetical protein
VDRWHTISEFRGEKSRNIASGFAILRSPKCRWSEGVEKSNSRVYQSFGKSGFGSRRDKLFDIASAEIAIGKIPKGKGKVSVDCCRVSGIRETNARPLTSRSCEVRSPKCKEGIP